MKIGCLLGFVAMMQGVLICVMEFIPSRDKSFPICDGAFELRVTARRGLLFKDERVNRKHYCDNIRVLIGWDKEASRTEEACSVRAMEDMRIEFAEKRVQPTPPPGAPLSTSPNVVRLHLMCR